MLHRNHIKIAGLLLFLTLGWSAMAQNAQSIKDVTMSVNGTSSLHDWTSAVTDVSGTASLEVADGKLTDIQSLSLKIKVEGIESTKGRIMDGKTYKALESDDHPYITFKLASAKITPKGDKIQVVATGPLTIAGSTKTVNIAATGAYKGNNIHFSGSKALKMTDFGIDPPTAMLGTLKTGDDITIDFSLVLDTAGNSSSR